MFSRQFTPKGIPKSANIINQKVNLMNNLYHQLAKHIRYLTILLQKIGANWAMKNIHYPLLLY